MATKREVEAERRYEVDQSKLPKDIGEPWPFIQAHFKTQDGKDRSLRLIPSCNKAFLRAKDDAFGIRDKESTQMSLRDAMDMLREHHNLRDNVALKYRYFVRDGRGWLLDHFPEHKQMQAETEFKTPEEFWKGPDEKPPFLGKEQTWDEAHYTRSLGKKRSMQEIQLLVRLAKAHGCKEPYDPDAFFKEMNTDAQAQAEPQPIHAVT